MPSVFPDSLPASAISLARRPAQGGECAVWLSTQRAFVAASQTGGSGQPCAVFDKVALAGRPARLAAVLLSPATDGVALSGEIGVYGLDQDGVALSGEASIETPEWLGVPEGTPVPVGSGFEVAVPTGKRFARIDAVYPPAGLKVALVAVPDDFTLHHVGCVTGRELSLGRDVRLLATGAPRDRVQWLPGSDLSVSGTTPTGLLGGIGRYTGSACSALIRVTKEGINSENLLIVDWTPTQRLNAPEGESLVGDTYNGPFAAAIHFLSRNA